MSKHCKLLGLDKHGLTRCDLCPGAVRSICHDYKYTAIRSWDDINSHIIDLAKAVKDNET